MVELSFLMNSDQVKFVLQSVRDFPSAGQQMGPGGLAGELRFSSAAHAVISLLQPKLLVAANS